MDESGIDECALCIYDRTKEFHTRAPSTTHKLESHANRGTMPSKHFPLMQALLRLVPRSSDG